MYTSIMKAYRSKSALKDFIIRTCEHELNYITPDKGTILLAKSATEVFKTSPGFEIVASFQTGTFIVCDSLYYFNFVFMNLI